ncbi:hypothetical protein [Huintestinicola butyrica]|uniref:hypothetical protein n=1 Tax=Huintestinicola butyrica TaxID=2981728 RepID=UPI003F7D7111
MSDNKIRIISAEYDHVPDEEAVQRTVEFLNANITADKIYYRSYDFPEFIDCGSNLEYIKCPCCNADISFEWWGEQVDKAIENDFESLDVTMPCCGKSSSLNDLKYHFPCGFACAEFVVENPESELGNENIIELEKILDTKLRVIHCHM